MADDGNSGDVPGFTEGEDGVFPDETGDTSGDYSDWDWKHIMAAITGGAAYTGSGLAQKAAGYSNPQTVQDAADTFWYVQEVLKEVGDYLSSTTETLIGENGFWTGEAATGFGSAMSKLAQQTLDMADVLSGGITGDYNVPQQLANNAQHLYEAIAKIKDIDVWYAKEAVRIDPDLMMDNGLVRVSGNQKIVDMMTEDMRQVLIALAKHYKINKDSISQPTSPDNPTTGDGSTTDGTSTTGDYSTSGYDGTTGGYSTSGYGGTTGDYSTSGGVPSTSGAYSTSGYDGTTGNYSTSGYGGTTGNYSTSGGVPTTGGYSTSGNGGTTGGYSTTGYGGTTDGYSTTGYGGTTDGYSTTGYGGTTDGYSTSGYNGTAGNYSTSGYNGTTGYAPGAGNGYAGGYQTTEGQVGQGQFSAATPALSGAPGEQLPEATQDGLARPETSVPADALGQRLPEATQDGLARPVVSGTAGDQSSGIALDRVLAHPQSSGIALDRVLAHPQASVPADALGQQLPEATQDGLARPVVSGASGEQLPEATQDGLARPVASVPADALGQRLPEATLDSPAEPRVLPGF